MSPAPPPAHRPAIIAIDGPAASGKGTLARRLAAHFGFAYLDSGLLYRAVGVKAVRARIDLDDGPALAALAAGLEPGDLDDDSLRGDDAADAASRVAALPKLRAALLAFQREFATDPPGGRGAVLDGRDIGTVVCPDAPYKIFLEAAVETRAARRLKELRERGIPSIQAAVLQDLKARDERDISRRTAPLVPAADAFRLETSAMDADAVFDAALEIIASRNHGAPQPSPDQA
ncbi:MAG: (d)CMP kinase [Alphaproteobacteria bacterium]